MAVNAAELRASRADDRANARNGGSSGHDIACEEWHARRKPSPQRLSFTLLASKHVMHSFPYVTVDKDIEQITRTDRIVRQPDPGRRAASRRRSLCHHIAGNAVAEGGLMIDLSGMRTIDVDAAQRTAAVGAGALLGDVDRATQAHGLATPLGINSTTGTTSVFAPTTRASWPT
jgi:FAD binding domain